MRPIQILNQHIDVRRTRIHATAVKDALNFHPRALLSASRSTLKSPM